MDTKVNYNILVTGVGAIIGYGIIESLRMSGKNVTIIGIDIYSDCYGRYVCDHFEVAPYTSDPNYFTWLNGICDKYKIDLIMPGIEQDLFALNENRDKIPCKAAINRQEIINISKDKLETFNYISNIEGINVISSLTGLNFEEAEGVFGLPFIIKPRKSYASKGFHVIKDRKDYEACKAEINENTVFQPYIGTVDDEYTFSAFGDGEGGVVDKIILRRYLSQEGATQKAYVIKEDAELEDYVNKLVAQMKPIGPTNFQFRKYNGKAYLLEINPRVSSACSIRSKFGYNEPKYSIELFLENGNFNIEDKKGGHVIRYIADHVIYE